jgi:site-specific DNA recombinase
VIKTRLRCAVYTRKSTEEGLEQSFNSLDAQFEACSAYILSQAGEGWIQVKDRYDDGGFSGGNMDRPGLKRLLADIEAGRVDVVVVYKVDRLTRALSDFARIVDVFDQRGASFVSVTQAFNTTTSMGRLTLNVLLSFAQFEREVTGERIRDKIAASKAKGLWMGGYPPLGYVVRDHALHVDAAEVETVRNIFQRYLELPGTVALCAELERTGVRSKVWTSSSGRKLGGNVFSRGGLNYLLHNRIYVGEVTHRGKAYPGQHEPIVSADVFEAVQCKLANRSPPLINVKSTRQPYFLLGKLFDDRGNAMTSASANKNGVRYFYYKSTALSTGKVRGSIARVSAPKLEDAIVEQLEPMLRDDWLPEDQAFKRVAATITRVTLYTDRISIELRVEAVTLSHLVLPAMRIIDESVTFDLALKLKPTQRGRTLLAGSTTLDACIDRALVRAIVLARRWSDQIASGSAASVREIARREGHDESYARQILPLAFLAPDLTETVLEGRQPASLSLAGLLAKPLPMQWADQRSLFAQFA